jgi:site-specific recombinase XerD
MKDTIRATVKVAGRQRERRFAAGTPKKVINRWKDDEEARIRTRFPASAKPRTGAPGTLAADIERVIPLRKQLASWTDYCALLRAWGPFIGHKSRDAVAKTDILAAMGAWTEAGAAARTINNRLSALRQAYAILDGEQAPTPCDGVRWLKPPKSAKQLVPVHIVNRVCAKLLERHEAYVAGTRTRKGRPGGQHALKDRARLMVMSACGKRPAEVGRAEPLDLDLERRVWYDRTAKDGDSPGIYLNDEMLLAWQEFIDADAWGEFSEDGHFARRLHDAGWPTGVKPYNVRHSAWTAASERGADLADIQVGAGHKRIETTRKHYVPVLNSRMQRLSEMIDKRHGWTPRVIRGKETA